MAKKGMSGAKGAKGYPKPGCAPIGHAGQAKGKPIIGKSGKGK